MKYIASLSGGKDSTAMIHVIIENKMPLDEVIFIDTGMEFPEMYDHVAKVKKYIARHNIPFTTIKAEHSFEYYLVEKPIKPRDTRYQPHNGYGWPLARCRWCTNRLKIEPVNKYLKSQGDIIEYIGFAYDEPKRYNNGIPNRIYPLVAYEMTEKDCLEYCYSLGYDWGGLYEKFKRVSCWCCPLQNIESLRTLYRDYPELWNKLETWDMMLSDRKNRFKGNYRISELRDRFEKEVKQ